MACAWFCLFFELGVWEPNGHLSLFHMKSRHKVQVPTPGVLSYAQCDYKVVTPRLIETVIVHGKCTIKMHTFRNNMTSLEDSLDPPFITHLRHYMTINFGFMKNI